MLGTVGKITECILFLQVFALILIPPMAHFTATTDVCSAAHYATFQQSQALMVEVGIATGTIATIANFKIPFSSLLSIARSLR